MTEEEELASLAQIAKDVERTRFADGREVARRSVPELIEAHRFRQRVSSAPFNRTTLTSFARD